MKVEIPKTLKIYVGVEIHQQLNTKKLHCNCYGKIISSNSSKKIIRKLNISESELGEIDIAAKRELLKNKFIIYEIFDECDCLVDIDEEPPTQINEEALKEALKICGYFNAKVPDELYTMRKIIIDGSIPSGFQRTTLIGYDGYFYVKNKKIKINSICLEEESGRKIKEDEDFIYFRLDRLGIPLIEISTDKIEITLEELDLIREVLEFIGLSLRFFNVRRGIGTIRQDLNVSIEGLDRVELKGVQDLDKVPLIIYNEVFRQYVNLKVISPILKRVKFGDLKDLTHVFKNTNCNFIKRGIDSNKKVFGFKLEGCKGLFSIEIQKGKRFGKEIAEYVSLYSKVKGILHGDELPAYGISEEEVELVRKELNLAENDNFVLFLCEEGEKNLVRDLIVERLNQYKNLAVRETRKINEDCTSTFMRPMPTSARMYPETDLLPIRVNLEDYEKIKGNIKKEIEEVWKCLENTVQDKNKVKKIIREGKHFDMYYLIKKYGNEHRNIIIKYFYEVPKKYDFDISLDVFEKIMDKYIEGFITKEAIEMIIVDLKKGKSLDESINSWRKIPDEKLREIVIAMIKEGCKVGEIMKKLRGRADLSLVSKIIRELQS